ncbi:MAG: flavodoxin-dependent (E)-4-hydroxy-3-methylbut-2-enyl-diphosphate synthase, partial [Verrucomicrobiota bacterium]|nr:flavodoxin-dependent (E)-4-hydroxy-3-methylbut-2-enyl-diphosphate synthase [Verrucomicrobiota bacterium]
PIYEVPVARELADKAMTLWKQQLEMPLSETTHDSINPFDFNKRSTRVVQLSSKCAVGGENTPAVIIKTHHAITNMQVIIKDVCATQMSLKEIKIEGLHIVVNAANDLDQFTLLYEALNTVVEFFVLELDCAVDVSELETFTWPENGLAGITLLQHIPKEDAYYAAAFLQFCRDKKFTCAIDCSADDLREEIGVQLSPMGTEGLILCSGITYDGSICHGKHPVGTYRALAEATRKFLPDVPIWIRNTACNTLEPKDYFSDRLLEASLLSGAILCDGIGDLISIETEPLLNKATSLAYQVLQGARARITKTEFVACPSCGRTLFDLQSVTQNIRSRTEHLK